MLKNTRRGVVGLLFPLLLTTLSCGDDIIDSSDYEIDKVTARPSLALPLAHGSVGIADFLSEEDGGNIQVYSNGLVYLLYEEELVTKNIRDLLSFPNTTFAKTISLPPGVYAASGSDTQIMPPLVSQENFNFDPERLREIKFTQGTELLIDLTIQSADAFDFIEVEIVMPDFKKNGLPLSRKLRSPSGPVSIPLEGYIGTLDNNVFDLEIRLVKKAHSSPLVILPGEEKIFADLTFFNVQYEYIKGFFGDQTTGAIPADVIEVNAFGNSLTEAGVSFADPKITFTVSNEYGIPTRVDIQPLEARRKDGSVMPITLNLGNPVTTNAPAQLGEVALTNVSVTNASELLNFVPDELAYTITSRINAGLTDGNNFCADTSSLDVKMRVEVPLYGKASNIVMSDTFDIDLEDLDETEIESAGLLTKVENEIPLDATIQIYLLTEDNVVTDSLFANATTIVKGSTVNTSGELVTPGVTNTVIEISKTKLDKLFDAAKIVFTGRLNTSKNSSGTPVDVQFRNSYKMNVNFGLSVKLKLEAEL